MSGSFVSRWAGVTALAAFIAACAPELVVPSASAGNLVIRTQGSIAANAIAFGGAGLQATLHNTSSQTFYAKIGDAFNSADEQDPLATSQGSDGVVEGKGAMSSWFPLTQGVMVEGTKYIALKPGKTYQLVSLVAESGYRGQARIRVRYSDAPNANGMIYFDYSNAFEIK